MADDRDLTPVPYDLLVRLIDAMRLSTEEQQKIRAAVDSLSRSMDRQSEALEKLEDRLESGMKDLTERVRGNGKPGLEARMRGMEVGAVMLTDVRRWAFWLLGAVGTLMGGAAALWGALQ